MVRRRRFLSTIAALPFLFYCRALSATEAEGNIIRLADYNPPSHSQGTVDAALRAAINATRGRPATILFPAGRFRFEREFTINKRHQLTLVGNNTTIEGEPMRAYFNLVQCSNIGFRGIVFDTRGGAIPKYESYADGLRQAAIRFYRSNGLSVEQCEFRRLYTAHIVVEASSLIKVVNCSFDSPLQNQGAYLVFIELLSSGGSINISTNCFRAAPTSGNDRNPSAISMSGVRGNILISQNKASHCGRNNRHQHRLGVFDIYTDGAGISVIGNTVSDCHEQFMRISTSQDVVVRENIVTVAPGVDPTYSTLTIESGSFPTLSNPVAKRILIEANRFSISGNSQAFAVGVIGYDWGGAPQDITVKGNAITGYDRSFYLAGPLDKVQISHNFVQNVRAFLEYEMEGSVSLTSRLGREEGARVDQLVVEDNIVELRRGSPVAAVAISTSRQGPFKGRVGDIIFNRNRLTAISPQSQFGVSALLQASPGDGNFYASDNVIDGYSVPFYLRSVALATLSRNRHASAINPVLTDLSVRKVQIQ